MNFIILNLTLLCVFAGGFVSGYYIALKREHDNYMKKLDDLKKTLSDCDRELRKRASQWEFRPKS